MAACWLLLYRATGDERFRKAGMIANRYVRCTMRLDGPPETRGAIKGSFPVSGGYLPFQYPNWACKFFIDANSLEKTICEEESESAVPIHARAASPLIERVAASDPTNPFYTPEYASACESLGEQPCFIGLCRGEEVVSGCIGFFSGSFLRRSLAIPSLPSIPNPQTFWRGLLDFCRKSKVWRLQIDTYGSPAGEIPQLPGELMRRDRQGTRA